MLIVTIICSVTFPVLRMSYLLPGSVFMALFLFLLLRDIKIEENNIVYRIIKHLSAHTFGIYLCHRVILVCITDKIFMLWSGVWYVKILGMLVTFILSYILSYLLSRLPKKSFIVG